MWWSPRSDAAAIWNLLRSSWINIALLLLPLGVLAVKLQWGAVAVFFLVRVGEGIGRGEADVNSLPHLTPPIAAVPGWHHPARAHAG